MHVHACILIVVELHAQYMKRRAAFENRPYRRKEGHIGTHRTVRAHVHVPLWQDMLCKNSHTDLCNNVATTCINMYMYIVCNVHEHVHACAVHATVTCTVDMVDSPTDMSSSHLFLNSPSCFPSSLPSLPWQPGKQTTGYHIHAAHQQMRQEMREMYMCSIGRQQCRSMATNTTSHSCVCARVCVCVWLRVCVPVCVRMCVCAGAHA